MSQKIYISGRISGIEDTAAAIFENAEYFLNQQGNIVVNPMKLPHNHDKSWESYMREDLKALLGCDAIYMLKNWQESRGAIIEHQLAESLNLIIIFEK